MGWKDQYWGKIISLQNIRIYDYVKLQSNQFTFDIQNACLGKRAKTFSACVQLSL